MKSNLQPRDSNLYIKELLWPSHINKPHKHYEHKRRLSRHLVSSDNVTGRKLFGVKPDTYLGNFYYIYNQIQSWEVVILAECRYNW